MKLAITLAATKGYLYAWRSTIRKMITAARHRPDVHVIFVSDKSNEANEAFEFMEREIPKDWSREHRSIETGKAGEPYKVSSQVVIARLHGEMFSAARQCGADQCWTIEPDILVRPDSLRMMEWALQMPQEDGTPYYDIAICTYPNGLFIGGHGEPNQPIAEDFLPEERKLPDHLRKKYNAFKEEEADRVRARKPVDKSFNARAQALHAKIKSYPPKGNIWQLNAEFGWRRRGWMDFAYPGIGLGAIVPIDWVGQGCNLLSKKALSLSSFEGYDGQGTQDLFLCWRKYYPAGLRMACVTHSPCDHVKKQQDGKPLHLQAFHESSGEARGHLRVQAKPWMDFMGTPDGVEDEARWHEPKERTPPE